MSDYSVDLDVLRHVLLDHTLTQIGDAPLQTSFTSPLKIGSVAFTPTADLAIRVLNREDDKDDDAVFGANAHIAYDLQSAWVKYKLSADASERIPFGALSSKANASVELADYRIHEATTAAWNAVQQDLSTPRTLLELSDVKKLQPGEALTLELGGSLSASVTFGWADALATKLADVIRDFPTRVPVALKLKSGLETTASVKVTDQFSVVISRTRDSRFRIAVKKARSRDHSFGIEVAFGAEANAVPGIEDVLAPLLDTVTNAAQGAAEEKAAALLRGEVESTLRKRLEAVARWKASTGFAYEYARIDENTSVADYILLDDTLLDADYSLVLGGDFVKITDVLRRDPDARKLVRYLNETELTRRSSSGFSLGIGKWIDVEAEDQSVFRQTTRTSIDGFRLITTRGTRRYEEKSIPQNDFEWVIDVKAQMREFLETPTTRDFDFGLQHLVTLERTKLSEDDLERMLDFARMWDVCPPDASEFGDALGERATVKVQLLFERDELAATLATFGDAASFADALGAAMPYASSFAERRSFDSRREIYADAWRAWFRGETLDLRPRIKSGLILLEERALPGSFAWASGDGHPQLRRRLDAFLRGARRLHDAMTLAQEPETIGAAYDDLQQFWTQRLYVAAAGRYLLDCARTAGVEPSRSLQVEYEEGTMTVA